LQSSISPTLQDSIYLFLKIKTSF